MACEDTRRGVCSLVARASETGVFEGQAAVGSTDEGLHKKRRAPWDAMLVPDWVDDGFWATGSLSGDVGSRIVLAARHAARRAVARVGLPRAIASRTLGSVASPEVSE